MELTNCDFKQVIAEDKLYILHQGEREHVMFAKFLREFVLVLGKKKKKMLACCLTFLLES